MSFRQSPAILLAVCLGLMACSPPPSDSTAVPTPASEGSTAPQPNGVDLAWSMEPEGLEPRGEVAAATTGSQIFVFGGFGESRGSTSTIEIFDIASRSWTLGPSLLVPVNHPMAAAVGETVFLIGGFTGTGQAIPTNRVFAFEGGELTEIASMPQVRAAGGACALDGKVYVTGGRGQAALSSTTLVLDPVERKWDELPGLITRRHHLGMACHDSRLFAFAGRLTGPESSLDSAEAFDIRTGLWSELPAQPTVRSGNGSAATENGFVVSIGGETGGSNPASFDTVEAFDTLTGEWIVLPPLPGPRHGLGVVAVGNTVYVVHGAPAPGYDTTAKALSIDLSRLRE